VDLDEEERRVKSGFGVKTALSSGRASYRHNLTLDHMLQCVLESDDGVGLAAVVPAERKRELKRRELAEQNKPKVAANALSRKRPRRDAKASSSAPASSTSTPSSSSTAPAPSSSSSASGSSSSSAAQPSSRQPATARPSAVVPEPEDDPFYGLPGSAGPKVNVVQGATVGADDPVPLRSAAQGLGGFAGSVMQVPRLPPMTDLPTLVVAEDSGPIPFSAKNFRLGYLGTRELWQRDFYHMAWRAILGACDNAKLKGVIYVTGLGQKLSRGPWNTGGWLQEIV
jgi:hypothetical protein